MAWKDFLLGQNPSDVQLNPAFDRLRQGREGLQGMLQAEASGTAVTPGEQAASLAGQQASEQAVARSNAMAAGARGFGRVAAQSQAAGQAAQMQQGIAGQTAAAAAAARGQGVQAARQGLMQMSEAELRQLLLEEEMRKANANPGMLSTIGSLAGAGLGALGTGGSAKGAMAGAQIGGLAGTGISGALR